MVCKNCGYPLKLEDKFCPKCGMQSVQEYYTNSDTAPLPEAFAPTGTPTYTAESKKREPMTKAKKAKIIVLSVLSVILIVGAAIGIKYLSGAEHKVIKALDGGNYSEAVSIYESELSGKSAPLLKSALKSRIEKIKSGFKNGDVDYDAAKDELAAIARIGEKSVAASAEEAKSYVDSLKLSKEAYASGAASYEKSDWLGAITNLKNVDESDENYASAKEKYDSAVKNYKNEVLKAAKDCADKGLFEKAVAELNTALNAVGTDEELNSALASYKGEYFAELKKDAIKNSAEKAAANDYGSAIKAIKETLEITGSDPELQSILDGYTQKYVAKVIETADALVGKRNYSAAVSEINGALEILPDNEELKAKKEKLEAEKPVSLSTLTPINGGFTWNDGLPTDPFGKTYTDLSGYALFKGEYWSWNQDKAITTAEYRVYGKYKYISGALSPHADINEDAYSQVKIYADDKLVYTSPAIGRKTDLVNFNADISGADYIKIVVEVKRREEKDGNNKDSLILMDVQLWSK